MIRTDNLRTIAMDYKDRCDLFRQLESLFIESDRTSEGYSYSGSYINARYPKVWELFELLRA